MVDPIVPKAGGIDRVGFGPPGQAPVQPGGSSSFQDMLQQATQRLDVVRAQVASADASAAQQSESIEKVLEATQHAREAYADTMSLRSQVVEAYEALKRFAV